MAGEPRYLAAMPRDFSTLAIFAWLVAGLACSGRTDKGQQVRPPPQVSVARVEVRDVAVEVHAPIDLRPLTQAEVGSKTLGYLDAVFVDRGDPVKRGQIVALVRPSDLPDQLAAARSALAQAEAAAALAGANRERASSPSKSCNRQRRPLPQRKQTSPLPNPPRLEWRCAWARPGSTPRSME